MENAADEKVEDGGRRTDRISNLPKEILYSILYLLSKREAAQTCVLSKSWRYLWSNRLRLSYSEKSPLFDGPHRTRLFISRINKFLQAHLDHNHRIETLRLVVVNPESISFLEKWIPMLIAIGVKELFLYILPKGKRKPTSSYVNLPSSVFDKAAKSIERLHVSRCNLGGQMTTSSIPFDRLKVLVLKYVNFTDEHIFDKIISSCPMITTMCFEECKGLKTIKLLGGDKEKLYKYLNHFTFSNQHTHKRRECSIETPVLPTLETMDIFGSKIRFHGHKFDNLKELFLTWLKFSSNSFDCSSCYEFPLLRSLSLEYCHGLEQFDQLIHINAPKIMSFQYYGPTIPPITFTTPMSRECKSDIAIGFDEFEYDDPQTWFLKLRGLLQVLSQSVIHLSVYQYPWHNIRMNTEALDINIFNNKPPVVVEELGLNVGHLPSFPSLLNGLFSICRPRYIGQQKYVRRVESVEENDMKELTKFFCNFLVKRSDNGCGKQELYTSHEDLEELSVECFDASREQWQPMMMSECAALPGSERIRFRLKWSEDVVCESSSKRRKLE